MPEDARRAGHPAGRPDPAGPAPAAVRRRHQAPTTWPGCSTAPDPHLMVTDPPYGVDYDPAWRNEAGVVGDAAHRQGRQRRPRRLARGLGAVPRRRRLRLARGDPRHHGGGEPRSPAASSIRAQIVWAKNRFALGRGDYHWQHEPCWYAVRKGARSHWQGARDQSTLWSIAAAGAEDAATPHGTQKPVEAMRRPIVNNSARGDAVYEPFCGSGTTLIAAETVGRVCFAMELEPRLLRRHRRSAGRRSPAIRFDQARGSLQRHENGRHRSKPTPDRNRLLGSRITSKPRRTLRRCVIPAHPDH